jgi:hypothetical protein
MTYIIAMIVVLLNGGLPQYWYTINEVTTFETNDLCETQIVDTAFQQQVLKRFNTIFENKVAMVRLSCVHENKIDEYREFMNEHNNKHTKYSYDHRQYSIRTLFYGALL